MIYYECKDNHFIPYKEEKGRFFSISYTITAKKKRLLSLWKQQPHILIGNIDYLPRMTSSILMVFVSSSLLYHCLNSSLVLLPAQLSKSS